MMLRHRLKLSFKALRAIWSLRFTLRKELDYYEQEGWQKARPTKSLLEVEL